LLGRLSIAHPQSGRSVHVLPRNPLGVCHERGPYVCSPPHPLRPSGSGRLPETSAPPIFSFIPLVLRSPPPACLTSTTLPALLASRADLHTHLRHPNPSRTAAALALSTARCLRGTDTESKRLCRRKPQGRGRASTSQDGRRRAWRHFVIRRRRLARLAPEGKHRNPPSRLATAGKTRLKHHPSQATVIERRALIAVNPSHAGDTRRIRSKHCWLLTFADNVSWKPGATPYYLIQSPLRHHDWGWLQVPPLLIHHLRHHGERRGKWATRPKSVRRGMGA